MPGWAITLICALFSAVGAIGYHLFQSGRGAGKIETGIESIKAVVEQARDEHKIAVTELRSDVSKVRTDTQTAIDKMERNINVRLDSMNESQTRLDGRQEEHTLQIGRLQGKVEILQAQRVASQAEQ